MAYDYWQNWGNHPDTVICPMCCAEVKWDRVVNYPTPLPLDSRHFKCKNCSWSKSIPKPQWMPGHIITYGHVDHKTRLAIQRLITDAL